MDRCISKCRLFFKRLKMITENRKEKLKILSEYISNKLQNNQSVNLIFICVQNSRRSHLAQAIAQHYAFKYGIQNVFCYSGGVEVTQIHSNTLKALKKMGYTLTLKENGENPVYELKYDSTPSSILLYSKNFEEVTKHLKNFAAVMVCAETESNCPYVPGAEKKILIPYNDPKIADYTENAIEEYLKVAQQIEEEMNFVFLNIQQGVRIE